MLSFPKLVRNWPKTRLEIWRSVVAPSDATEKNRNIGAQLQSILYTTAQKDFGKFTSCRTFNWCAQTCSFQAVFGLPIRNLTIDVCAMQWRVEKIIYRCTSAFSVLNYQGGIFFKSLSYLYEVVRTNFSADFWTFRNFSRQFRENCGATWRRRWEPCSAPDRAFHPSAKIAENGIKIDP